MTDKVIIDGVDVSECEFFTPTSVMVLGGVFETQIHCGQVNEFSDDAFTQNAPNLHCERCHNCYFKQLKRAEQECEELKTIINKSAEKFANDYLETFEENEKLKEELQNVQHNCTREGCRYYEDNTYKVFYKCKAKTEADKMEQKIKLVKILLQT